MFTLDGTLMTGGLSRLPHVLVASATNLGKSVWSASLAL